MADVRTKVIVLGSPGAETHQLEAMLGGRCDLVYAESIGPEHADASFVVTLAEPGSLGLTGLGDHERDVLLRSIGEAICLVTAGGRLLWGNAMFGGLREDVQQTVIAAAAEAAASFQGRPASTGSGPESSEDRRTHRWRGQLECGSGRVYELQATPMHTHGASQYGDRAVGIVRDITETEQAKRKIGAIDEAGSALARLDPETVRDMNAVERLKLLEERIVKASHDLLNYDHFGIRLIDQHTGRLEMVMSHGFPAAAVDLELYPAAEGNGIIGRVAATGTPYICKDSSVDESFLPGATGAMSSLTVPLKLQDRIIGVLDIESLERNAFDQSDLQFAVIFARYVAMALQTLNMLVIERSTTGRTISSRFEGELDDPLSDILKEVGELSTDHADPDSAAHIERIKADVHSIRERMQAVAQGPNTLLGVGKALGPDKADPMLVGKRVLIADDQAQIRNMIADVLRRRGCDTVVCASGQEAINELDQSSAEGHLPFDMVVSDISMPDRNGYEIFAVARGVLPEHAIILMTGFGYDPHHSIVRASQHGMKNVLYKPFQAQRLIDEAHRAITGEGPAPGGDDPAGPVTPGETNPSG
ncbi:MAG: response regulator [Planctomycetota bacterium]